MIFNISWHVNSSYPQIIFIIEFNLTSFMPIIVKFHIHGILLNVLVSNIHV
jgi:hypothetical protein